MSKYILITESALDRLLVAGEFSGSPMLPVEGSGVHKFELAEEVIGYRVASEPAQPVLALIGIEWMEFLGGEGARANETYRRIARVIKGLKSPPIHLPRQWSEYHFKNLLAFFALPREISSARWIVDINSAARCARFDHLTSYDAEEDLTSFQPKNWPKGFDAVISAFLSQSVEGVDEANFDAMAQEVDLKTIGSASVVGGRTYEEWLQHLTDAQASLLDNAVSSSIRIVGPAGSGKTLSLCMRAIQVSRDEGVRAQGKRLLLATHSWAMSERIDGILAALNGGVNPEGITVFPLLSLLELHAGHIGQRKTEVIGTDSTDGRVKSLEIIADVVSKFDVEGQPSVSAWIGEGLSAPRDGRRRLDLAINLYEELSGVLAASGVAPDDPEAIREYLGSPREDWMPPFDSVEDRIFVVSVYKFFIQELVDRSAITTDQFILDSIRVLETFTWRMRKETEGYDFIFVDELQLFDPQERSALELLGRSRRGVPFVTAEDPAQGVFSALNSRRSNVDNVPVYLEVVHRFNKQIFEFINFIYQQFPLNALPLRIHDKRGAGKGRPTLRSCGDEEIAIKAAADIVQAINQEAGSAARICVVTLGEVDESIAQELTARKLNLTRLESFDDVERLAYSKRSIVVAPWQFIGGTQFTHVVVLALRMRPPSSQFDRLREMISVYLSCSRATETLSLICDTYVPAVVSSALDEGFLTAEGQ